MHACINYIHTYRQTNIRTIHYKSIPFHAIPYLPYHSLPFHTIPLRCITYHYIPFHYVPLQYVPLHYSTFHCNALHCVAYHTIPYHNVCMYTCRIHYMTNLCIHTYHTSVHLKYLSIYNGHIYRILYFSLLHLSTLLRWQIMLKCSLATPRLLESRGSDGP